VGSGSKSLLCQDLVAAEPPLLQATCYLGRLDELREGMDLSNGSAPIEGIFGDK
jgi:hypothetical protein